MFFVLTSMLYPLINIEINVCLHRIAKIDPILYQNHEYLLLIIKIDSIIYWNLVL